MAALDLNDMASDVKRCLEHGLALGPDGRCILCKRNSTLPPGRSHHSALAHSSVPGPAVAKSGLPLAGMITAGALVALGYFWIEARPVAPRAPVAVPGSIQALDQRRKVESRPRDPEQEAKLRAERHFRQLEEASKVDSDPSPSPSARLNFTQQTITQDDETPQADMASAIAGLSVNLYSTSWCAYCRKARAFLTDNHIPYVDHNIEDDESARQRQRALNPKGSVPVLEIEGKSINGFDERNYARFIARAVEAKTGTKVRVELK